MSELQNRLEHLVNYSSQLIFVSGDTVVQQQRALEDFLAIQKENTEISYFTSELSMESPDFRRIICRQLLGQKVGSFVRPLKELLKDLHEQPGPFLLCIKQAQTIPNAFLQELWDWVTESKKQSPDHHVNVILFGETAWAEKAKKWLPKRNSSRPVLLSSQSIDSSSFDLNALQSLMAEERPTFSLSLFKGNEYSAPIVTQKWFITSILVILLVVFLGLMSWQYPTHVKSLLQTGQFPPEAELGADQLAIVNEQLDAQVISQQEQNLNTLEPSDSESVTLAALQNIQTSKMNDSQSNSSLVNSWGEAKKNSDKKIDTMKQTITIKNEATPAEIATSELTIKPTQAALANTITADNTIAALVASEQDTVEDDVDFAVPDIFSVEQLDATLGNNLLPSNPNQTDSQAEESELQSLATTNTAMQPQVAKVDSEVYEYDEATILALNEPGVLLQISGIQNKSVLDEYIVDNDLKDSVWIYQTTRYGGPWHVVLINQRFASVAQARAAAALLPQSVQASSAFAKGLAQIKLEIRNR